MILEATFGGRFDDRDHALAVYEAHRRAVRETVPSAQLLRFSVAEGWGPLCAFLGCAVPDAPFPRENSREAFPRLFAPKGEGVRTP